MFKKPKKVAILGGSFDLPHLAHVLLSQWVLTCYDIDELWWMPCYKHQFQKTLSDFNLRLKMCRIAIENLPSHKVKLSDFEKRSKSDGKSLLMLRVLAKKYRHTQFILVIGSDNYKMRRRWYQFATLKKEFGIIVVPRGGRLGLPQISSSQIRQDFAQDKLKHASWLSPKLNNFIMERGVYRRRKLR